MLIGSFESEHPDVPDIHNYANFYFEDQVFRLHNTLVKPDYTHPSL